MNQTISDCLNHTLFTWTKQGGLNPIHVKKAEGVYLTDVDGKTYLDFSSQAINVNIGHGNKKVIQAITDQLNDVQYAFPSLATEPRAKLGKLLAAITPSNLNKAFFTLGGAEAIENAIKLARVYTGRPKIVSFYRSYHGATFAALGASGDPRKHPIEAYGVPHMVHVENPYFYRCPWNTHSPEECGRMAAVNLEQVILYENPDSIAAILMEGESGTSGCIKYPDGFWQQVREIADRYGILIIDDEVMSGFGRTGKMFACDRHGVKPDLMCLAKGLTSGYLPLGALMVSDDIAAAFNDRPLPLGLTYSAHPVSCAAAVANLNVILEEKLADRAVSTGEYINLKMAELSEQHPSIGDFRNTGLLGCVELVKNRKTKVPTTPWNAKPNEMEATARMASKTRELGMFTLVRWNWIFIAPPLTITKEQVDEGMDILSKTIEIADEYMEA